MKVPLIIRVVSLLLALVSLAEADWIFSRSNGDIAYFLNNASARLDRYDLKARQWLTPVTLPAVRGTPTAGWVDAQGIYIAYARSVYRYGLGGGSEVPVMNTSADVKEIVATGTHLFLYHPSGGTKLTSIAKATNTVVETKDIWYTISGLSVAADGTAIFGRDSSTYRIAINANGTIGSVTSGSYYGGSSATPKTWSFPIGGRMADSSGAIYSADSLKQTLSFGGAVNDLQFLGGDIPIVLRGSELVAYTNGMLPTGSKTLGYTPRNIYLEGQDVLVFTPDDAQANGIRVEAVALSELAAPTPGEPVNPVGLPYTPDKTFLDKNGILYLFSKAHQSLFRWDRIQQKYLVTIPLIGTPEYVAYSAENHTIYLAYRSGLIRKIDLGAATLAEQPFATTPLPSRGLATAGRYVFTSDESGSYTHYTFSPSGTLVDSATSSYTVNEYIWNEQNQKMYFFNYDSSPSYLMSEEINANGTAYPAEVPGGIGLRKQSPWNGSSSGLAYPIRVSPDGNIVVLGSGVIHNAKTLERLTGSLGNTVVDVAWLGSEIRTVRTVATVAQFQQWTGPTYAQGLIKQVPGTAHSLLALSSNRLLGVIVNNGAPSFYVLDSGFEIIPPAQLETPAGFSAVISSSSQVTLSWQDISGEAEYVIERRLEPTGAWQEIGTTTASVVTFQDASFAAGNSYSYRVAARNGALVSPFSTEVPVLLAAPATPTGVTATKAGSQQIIIGWADSVNESGYQVDRKTGPNGTWSQIATPAAGQTSFTNSSLAPGTQYFYRVRATNAFGVSPNSMEVSATTDLVAPTKPSYLSASASNSYSISLSWGSSSYEEKFVLERQEGSTGIWLEIATPGVDAYSYADSGLLPLTTYSYRIKAVNSVGESTYSSIASVTTPQITPPSAPTGLIARPDSATSVQIGWNNVSYETGYILQRRGDDPTSWADIATLSADITNYADSGLTTGVQYFYRVLAFNTAGNSAYSAADDATPLNYSSVLEDDFDGGLGTMWSTISGAAVSGPGQGFRDSPALWFGSLGTRSATTLGINTLQGGLIEFLLRAGNSAVDGSGFWDNSESGETVVLEYSINGGTWITLQTLNTVYPNFSTWTPVAFEIPSGARSENTRFRWRQYTHSGPGSDTWALEDVRIRTVLPPLPVAPTALFAMANSSSSVSLLWSAVSGASSYVVEQLIGEEWVPVASVSGDISSYRVNGLADDTTYAFRIRAGNAAGLSDGSQLSLVRTWVSSEDPSLGVVGFVSRTATAHETPDGGAATLTVQRRGNTTGQTSVNYTVSAGTATSGEDFIATTGTVIFAPGESSRTITVQLLPDTKPEPTETVTVFLSNPASGTELGTITTVTVSILDDDLPGSIDFASSASTAKENAGIHTVSVRRTGGESGSVSVAYAVSGGTATSGQDFVLSAGTLEFADSETSKAISIPITNDTEIESGETFTIVLSAPTGGAALGSSVEHTVTILDDEPFVPKNASYVALLRETDSEFFVGGMQFKTTATGRVTGKLLAGGVTRTFTGQLDVDGHFVAKIAIPKSAKRGGQEATELTVHMDISGDRFTAQCVAPTGAGLEGDGERLISADEIGSSQMVGQYTALLRGGEVDAVVQPIRGVARINITARGAVTMQGYAPDGRSFSVTTGITVQGRIPLALHLPRQGGVFGSLEIEPNDAGARLQGDVGWWKSTAGTFGLKAETVLSVAARRYVVPAAGHPPFAMSGAGASAVVTLYGEAMAGAVEMPIFFNGLAKLKASPTTGERVNLKVNRKTGLMDGEFRQDRRSRWKLRGAILQLDANGSAAIEGMMFSPAGLGGWSISPTDVD